MFEKVKKFVADVWEEDVKFFEEYGTYIKFM